MSKQIISTEAVPGAVGPYSQGTVANGFVFTAGQLGMVPGTKAPVGGGIEAQTEQALKNLKAVLQAAGCTLVDVVKTTVFLADMDDFAAMNGVYSQFFTEAPPARSAFQVARLPLGAVVEIEAVAALPQAEA